MAKELKGIAASDGIAIAKAYLLVEPDLSYEKTEVTDVESEVKRFESALEVSRTELSMIREKAAKDLGEDKAQIFDAHLLVLNDPELTGPIEESIKILKRMQKQLYKKRQTCLLVCLNLWTTNTCVNVQRILKMCVNVFFLTY